MKITLAGNETFEALREGQNDDIVLALSLGVYYGEKCQRRLVVGC
jgi:hypothetical protein